MKLATPASAVSAPIQPQCAWPLWARTAGCAGAGAGVGAGGDDGVGALDGAGGVDGAVYGVDGEGCGAGGGREGVGSAAGWELPPPQAQIKVTIARGRIMPRARAR